MKKYDWKKFWLSVLAVTVVLFVFFDIAVTVAKAEEIVIDGYQTGEYAVKGEVKERLDGIINQLSDKQVVITVAGSADTVGKSMINDELAAKRAEHARAYLAGKLPTANVKASWSEGDSANARQVKVVYSIITLPMPAPAVQPVTVATTSYFMEVARLLLISLAMACIILVPIFAWVYFKRRKRNQETAEAKPETEKVEADPETKWVEADNENVTYLVRVVKMGDGNWHTPFASIDKTKPLFRADFQSAKKAVRGCVKDLRYAEQFKRLLIAGVEIKNK